MNFSHDAEISLKTKQESFLTLKERERDVQSVLQLVPRALRAHNPTSSQNAWPLTQAVTGKISVLRRQRKLSLTSDKKHILASRSDWFLKNCFSWMNVKLISNLLIEKHWKI